MAEIESVGGRKARFIQPYGAGKRGAVRFELNFSFDKNPIVVSEIEKHSFGTAFADREPYIYFAPLREGMISRRGAFGSDIKAGCHFCFSALTGFMCQMLSAYSRIERSAAKKPAEAILLSDILFHFSLSA